ncbi:MAG: hypothetical protein ACRCTS_10240 [Fusobacteriaceae bacterium]
MKINLNAMRAELDKKIVAQAGTEQPNFFLFPEARAMVKPVVGTVFSSTAINNIIGPIRGLGNCYIANCHSNCHSDCHSNCNSSSGCGDNG